MDKLEGVMCFLAVAFFEGLESVLDWCDARGIPAWFVAIGGGCTLGMATRYGPMWLGVLIAVVLFVPFVFLLSMIATVLPSLMRR